MNHADDCPGAPGLKGLCVPGCPAYSPPPQKLFAFWKYDLFPYCLGAEVIRLRDDGRISAKGYDGYTFTPILVLPLEAGKKRWAEIEKLRRAYEAAEKKLKDEYNAKVLQVMTP